MRILLLKKLLSVTAALLASVVAASSDARAQSIQLEPVLTGLSSPLYVGNARDGSRRLFIVERGGLIRVLQNGSTTTTLFLDISSRVAAGNERGLLGLAFHPQFAVNRRFFVNYTRVSDGATVIAEYRASAANRDVADTAETVLLVIAQPFSNHNGGMIEFGNDGFLYIGMGDGGSANDPGNRAQNIDELLGKMLRIDIDTPNGSIPYSSPPDNPFFGATAGRDEIYAVGLRNPFRWSFDRTTGQLYAGDVGQGQREEIDIITLGSNYGWRVFEGTLCTNLDPPQCAASGFTAPIAEYTHASGRCSITGGYVYRGARASLPTGAYVYGDFCTGEIFKLESGVQSLLLDTSLGISSFGEDEFGELYVVGLSGTVSRIRSSVAPAQTAPGALIISEFRLRGAAGATDEYVELYNNTDAPIVVSAADGSAGFALAASDGATRFVVPNGTVIPARGHYLGVNSGGYSLGGYAGGHINATGNAVFAADIPDNAGLALFRTANSTNFTLANRLDAVGADVEGNPLYKEGAGYPALTPASANNNHAWHRDQGLTTAGRPKDTGDNAADFLFVEAGGASAGAGQRLGAPAPENLDAPIQRNSLLTVANLDPAQSASMPPNRFRDQTSDPVNNSSSGTLSFRKTITNNSTASITRLRFRIVDITSLPVPTGTADLRARTSAPVLVTLTGGGTATVQGTTLEEPPAQTLGGALNSSLSAGTVTLAAPLAPGASINLQVLLGVQQTGRFRFFFNVEVLP